MPSLSFFFFFLFPSPLAVRLSKTDHGASLLSPPPSLSFVLRLCRVGGGASREHRGADEALGMPAGGEEPGAAPGESRARQRQADTGATEDDDFSFSRFTQHVLVFFFKSINTTQRDTPFCNLCIYITPYV